LIVNVYTTDYNKENISKQLFRVLRFKVNNILKLLEYLYNIT